MSDVSLVVQVEIRMGGEATECERSLEVLRRGVDRWAGAQRTVTGKPIVRVQQQPVTERHVEPQTRGDLR